MIVRENAPPGINRRYSSIIIHGKHAVAQLAVLTCFAAVTSPPIYIYISKELMCVFAQDPSYFLQQRKREAEIDRERKG